MVCGISVDAALARSPRQDGISGNDLIWTTLLPVTSRRARPLPSEIDSVSSDALQRKLRVLGNLLDCAVQAPDKQLRRQYIGRIMGLPKHTQKTIMAMIEQRAAAAKNSSSSAQRPTPRRSGNSRKDRSSSSPNQKHSPSRLVQPSPSRRSRYTHNSNDNTQSTTSPWRNNNNNVGPATPQPQPSVLCSAPSAQALKQMNCNSDSAKEAVQNLASNCQVNPSSSPMRSALKKPNAPSRGHSVAFSAGADSGFTPDRKRPNNSSSSTPADRGTGATPPPPFLSPGFMESPNRLQATVHHLHRQTETLKQTVSSYQMREEECSKKVEQMESDFKQQMMALEAKSLDRIQTLERESEATKAELEEKLAKAETDAKANASAVHELAAAKEELEVAQHSKAVLAETSEQLRKFKEKLSELQDVREALQKEQEAHGQSVDEIVKLENELQTLQPFKKQVEDYKFRAIEAEVKLVECQDYLRRMEQQMQDQNSEAEYMFKDAILQKEQMQELQRRINEDTQRSTDQGENGVGGGGIGEGISELNPEIKQELTRLRNENLQLRAFQVKRSNDAVQHLEESLDESKRFAERYKHEYLGTKKTLNETKAALAESLQREADLQDDAMQWQDNYHELEQECANIKSDLQSCEKELEQTKNSLSEAEKQNEKLRQDVEGWMKTCQEHEVKSSERLEELQSTQQELNETKERLQSATETIERLEADVEALETTVEESAQTQQTTEVELDKTAWELDNTRNKLTEQTRQASELESQVKRLQKQQQKLEEDLEKERTIRKEESEVAQEALETTRHLLETKNKKEQEELQANMNSLLEAERKAYRAKDEEASQMLMNSEQEWHEKYVELQERSASSLKHSRQEAQERVDFIKQEYEQEMEKLRRENEEKENNLVRKGKKMMADAKALATAEMKRLDDECQELEDKYRRLEKERDELERLLNGKLASLRQQLQFANSQVDERTREADDYLDTIKTLEREKYKLSEENEQYRRQLGGRYGADGKSHSQLEKLQKEYNAVVEENRKLKKQVSSRGDLLLSSITEGGGDGDDDQNPSSYRKGGGVDRRALTQLRKEYEERIAELNDEKRDLIMKNTSAATDVHKAEKRAWEREEEISKLQQEITSLKLSLQRADLEADSISSSLQENAEKQVLEREAEISKLRQENAFLKLQMQQDAGSQGGVHNSFSKQENQSHGSPHREASNENLLPSKVAELATLFTARSPSPARSAGGSPSKLPRSSPSIDRAKKHKEAQEQLLRSRFTSMTGLRVSPPVAGRTKLALEGSIIDALPSNLSSDSSGADFPQPPENAPTSPSSMASDVFKLGTSTGASDANPAISSSQSSTLDGTSIMDFTQLNGTAADGSQPECKQS